MSEYAQSTDRKTLIFDVDGILVTYDGWSGIDVYGEPLQDNIDLVNKLYSSGKYQICIWSSRTNPYVQGYSFQALKDRLEKELKKIGVKYHKILNEPKPLFYCLIDDNSINPDGVKVMKLWITLEPES